MKSTDRPARSPSLPSRRGLIAAAAGGIAGAACPGILARPAAAAAMDLTICGTWDLTAPGIANTATLADRGSHLGVEMLSKEFGIAGRYVRLDSEGDPGKVVRVVNEQSSQKDNHLFVGGASSAVALAVSKEVRKLGGVYVTAAGADELTGSDCSKGTFRYSVATYGAVEGTVRPMREMMPAARRWFTITPKYVFGEALLRNTIRVLSETNGEHVGNAYHGLVEREFSAYLIEALAAKPEVLCVHTFAGQATDLIRQAAEFGLDKKMAIVVVWSAGLDQYQAIGPELMDGLYMGAQYWHTVQTEENTRFSAEAEKAFKSPPGLAEATGYMLVRLLFEGAAKAGSNQPDKIIAALEGLKYQGVTGPEEVRARDHQCIKSYYLGRGKPPSQMRDKYDFLEIVSTSRKTIDAEKAGCTAI